LRADAARLEVGQPRKKCSALAKKLIAAAEAYEQADRIVPSLSHVQLVKAVTEIADLMEERFGSTMLTLTATLASVALDRKITRGQVREWTKAARKPAA